jgi:hydroxyacylglutathione hydrolase
MPSTTLGYERLVNWAFQADDEREFVRAVLAGQPEPPRYFGRMKLLNRDGQLAAQTADMSRVDAARLARAMDGDPAPTVIDARSSSSFADGFIPGTLNIPAGRSFITWAGSLVEPANDVVLLVSGGESQARALARQLSLIGIDRVIGWADASLFSEWRAQRRPVDRARLIGARELTSLEGAEIIDVRGRSEWDAGHIPGARHLFLGDLPDVARGLPHDRPLVVACQGGTRSSIAASLLRAMGYSNVINFTGGFTEWASAGLPVETASASPATP